MVGWRMATVNAAERTPMTAAEIADALGGQRDGDSWSVRCPAHDDHDPSLSLTDRNGRVLVCCFGGCSQTAVIGALRERGLWPSANDRLRKGERTAVSPRTGNSKRAAAALRIWRQSQPAAGTIVGQYLRSRGIDLASMPEALRFHPALKHESGQTFPAMVAAVRDVSGTMVAIHRTFLRPDGSGKADVTKPKMMLGPVHGAAVRLTEAGERVVIGEGIESSLSVHVSTSRSTWAALSAGGIANLELPPTARDITIAVDNDDDGVSMRKAQEAAGRWVPESRIVRIAVPPDGMDFNDVLRQYGAARVCELIEAAVEVEAMSATGGDAESQRPPSQATVMYECAVDAGGELFHDGDDAYAVCPLSTCRATYGVRTRAFKLYLTRLYYERTRKAPNAEALQGALALCEAAARFDGEQHRVYTRIGEQDGNIYLDLCDDAWRAVEITPAGWKVVSDPPVRFRRPHGMLPLPEPHRGGHFDELRNHLNSGGDENYQLVSAWLVAALRQRGPYPVLSIHGEQGAAKSTVCRLLRNLIDPNAAGLRAEPRDARDLIIAATNGWIVALDNVSHLPAWLSDALCRLATGGGFGARELYTDAEEVLFNAMRPTLLNGITEVATRADLLDRTILIEAPNIPEDKRRTESDIMSAFEAARPQLLGALLDHVVSALANVDHVRLDRLPRMADFAVWAVAADPQKQDAFLAAYTQNRRGANDVAIDASEIGSHVLALVADGGEIIGTAAELLGLLNQRVEDSIRRQRGWPTTARALSGALRRIAPNLRAGGISVDFLPRSGRQRRMAIRREPERIGKQPSQPSPSSSTAETLDFPGDGTRDGDGTSEQTVTPTVTKKRNAGAANDGDDGGDGRMQPLSGGADLERF